ncbi:MAG: LTA synthase family protein [Lachnospiraceae bacterium]|nr:LTA synthase family protein [Lachnospiraceae bacterium]
MKAVRFILCILQVILIPCIVLFCLEYPENPNFFNELTGVALNFNLTIAAILSAIIIFIIPGIYPGIYLTFAAAAFSGIFNEVVIMLRTYPISPADVISVGTAGAVAGGYTVTVTPAMITSGVVAAVAIVVFALLRHFGFGFGHPGKRVNQAAFLGGILMMSLGLVATSYLDVTEDYDLKTYYWDPTRTYIQNGFALSFFDQFHAMMVEKPDGYTKKAAKGYMSDDANNIKASRPDFSGFKNQKPLIITIMNESFTDYSVVANFPDSKHILDYYRSMKDDPGTVEWGYTYVSTRGGGTCKSEYEVLTGYTMQFLPSTMPYMMYSFANVPTWISRYNAQDYTTIAMHPFFATNWKRNIVYSDMGFDSYLYAKDYDDNYRDVRDYKNDYGDYLRLLEEARAHDEATYIMNITLQNHGGYDAATFPDYVTQLRGYYDTCEDLKVFEGMMSASDDALEMFMEEIKKLDRPVEVVFFGDHQPGLSGRTDSAIKRKGQKLHTDEAEFNQSLYATPYFIWTNYRVPDRKYEKKVDGYNIMSLNYLGAVTRYYAGCDLSRFDGFLLRLKETFPVINSNGYYVDDLGFVMLDEKYRLSDEKKELLKEYEYIQYRGMFDNN